VSLGERLLREPEVKRFAFIDVWKKVWPIEQLCRVLKVTSRGYRAWRSRRMSKRQRTDLVILAHIREQHDLALGS
jgi:putative transposase